MIFNADAFVNNNLKLLVDLAARDTTYLPFTEAGAAALRQAA